MERELLMQVAHPLHLMVLYHYTHVGLQAITPLNSMPMAEQERCPIKPSLIWLLRI